MKSIEGFLKEKRALWRYGERKNEPHALLTSGFHSDGYVNLNYVLQYPDVRNFIAEEMIKVLKLKLEKEKKEILQIDTILSSSFGAIQIGQAVSDKLGVPFVFTEKTEGNQIWTGRFYLSENSNVLIVEDVITTGKSVHQVIEAMKEVMAKTSSKFFTLNNKILVVCIIARQFPPDFSIIALAHLKFNEYEASKCPLCKKGSQPLPPKKFWNLFQKYI
jgi:orotate phosphoribosyltransferase